MKVKITSCLDPDYWYATKIGSYYYVTEINGEDVYRLIDKFDAFIRKSDAAIISDFADVSPVEAPNPVNKYNRTIAGLDGVSTTVDVYRVLLAFDITAPELQHALKKLLCLGIRGKGDFDQDLDEAILSLNKLKERRNQWR